MKVPKHYQVKRALLDLIEGLDPQTAIPTERELAERFATSRTTVRQAIAALVVDGRLERTQGRGTFVAHPKLMRVRPLTSFSPDVQTDGWRPGSVLLGCAQVTADDQVRAALQLPPGAAVQRLDRLRTAGGDPIAHEIAHVPGPLPDFEERLTEHGSLYVTMREAYGLHIAAVEDTVETALADPVEANLLGVETGLPMLLIHRTAWDSTGRPVEWTRSVFRGDRFRFVARHNLLEPPAGAAGHDEGAS